ncbi:hypothetical protein D3C86_1053370 [compost metagenome]
MAGFLAAPLGANIASVNDKRQVVDVTPGSTLVTFASTLMTEAYPDFQVDKGFEGIKSQRLATLTQGVSPSSLGKAVGILDQSSALSEAGRFETLLGETATASAVLTSHVKALTQKAANANLDQIETGTALSFQTAVISQLVERIGAFVPDPANQSQSLFEAVAEQVDLGKVRVVAEQVRQQAAPQPLPTLPPEPSPIPNPGVGIVLQ